MSPERGLPAVVAAAEKRLVALLPHVNGVAAFEGKCDGRENRIFGETGCETFGIVGIAGFIIARPGCRICSRASSSSLVNFLTPFWHRNSRFRRCLNSRVPLLPDFSQHDRCRPRLKA